MRSRDCVEFLDEHGRPLVLPQLDEPEPLAADPPTLPHWLDPRTSAGRTVLGSLLVVFAAWVMSVWQSAQIDEIPTPAASTSSVAAAPVTDAAGPAGPGTDRDGDLGTLTGPGRLAAQLLGRLGEADGVIPSGDLSCSPGRRSAGAQERVAEAVRQHLPTYGVITATTGFGRRAKLCTFVLWAESGPSSVVLSIAAPTSVRPPLETRWQALSGRSGTLEWVRRVDRARWTVLVASFGPYEVPELSALLDLAHDPRLSW